MSRLFGVAPLGFLAAGGMLLAATCARAESFSENVKDTYYGGTAAPVYGDVVNGANDLYFHIYSMDVARAGNNLTVVVHTNYANDIGRFGTGLGSLFIGNYSDLSLTGSTPYATDTFTGSNTERFKYALQVTPNPVLSPAGNASNAAAKIYLLNPDGSDVKTSFAPPSGGTIRTNQAVGVLGTATDTTVTGSWSTFKGVNGSDDEPGGPPAASEGTGTITFSIDGLFSLLDVDDSFVLAWAMTCANDVMLYTHVYNPPNDGGGPTPIPGALPLFAAGLGLFGFVNYRRKKRMARAA